MEDPESAFCSAATGLGTTVITDEGVVAGPAVIGTPVEGVVAGPAVAGTLVGCFAREVLRLGQGLNSINSIYIQQAKKERKCKSKPQQATVLDLRWAPSWMRVSVKMRTRKSICLPGLIGGFARGSKSWFTRGRRCK
jgi:hypothetical protein